MCEGDSGDKTTLRDQNTQSHITDDPTHAHVHRQETRVPAGVYEADRNGVIFMHRFTCWPLHRGSIQWILGLKNVYVLVILTSKGGGKAARGDDVLF